MAVEIPITQEHMTQRHEFEDELVQPFHADIARDLEHIQARLPIRGDPPRASDRQQVTRARPQVSARQGATVHVGFLLLSGCCSGGRHHEVSGAEFSRLAALPMGSARDSRFIGATESRAYIAVWSARASTVGGSDVYSVALDDLPGEIAQQIRSGINPWARK